MNHPTPLELHDHAYGFRPSAHVAGCAQCLRAVEDLLRESKALRAALSETAPSAPAGLLRATRPARRTTLSVSGLAAAAAFLAALAWLLFRPPPRGGPPEVTPARSQVSPDSMEGLLAELKSPSPLRRELAALAVRTYGSATEEMLEKAHVDPAVRDQCLGISPEMRAIERKLDTLKLDLAFDHVKTMDLLASLRDFSGINLVINASSARWLPETSSLTIQGQSLRTALQKLCDSHGLKFRVTPELVVWLDDRNAREPEVRVPIRIRAGSEYAGKEIPDLESDEPQVRDRARLRLRRMGFAAERELWAALDGGSPERRARAGDLLRELYTQDPLTEPGPTEKKIRQIRCTIDMQNASLESIAGYLSEISELTILIDPTGIPEPESEFISFKVQDIVLDGALRLMLQPREKQYVVVDDLIVLTKAQSILRAPKPPFLATPEEAKKMEKLIEDLGSGDSARQLRAQESLVELGQPALGPVAQAAKNLQGAAAERARAVCLKIAHELGAWYADDQSGVDLQNLTSAQKTLLRKEFTERLEGKPLPGLLEGLGFRTRFKAGESLKPRGQCRKARVDSFLRATLRPAGLDFYLDGETIVVDTAGNVVSALKK